MDGNPEWSPDGSWIAFLRGRPPAGKKMGLYLIPALGGRERKLAETRVPSTYALGSCLAWSPDSRWLAVCDWAEDSPGRLRLSVFLLSVDSGERRRLTWPPEDSIIGDVLPAFSPDGRTLAFSRYSSVLKADLYLLDLDEDLNPRGEPRRRTFMEQLAGAMPKSFTSDGRDIVFWAGSMDNSSLWRVPVSGTASPERLPFGENGLWPHLSRQGNRLAYTVINSNMNIYRLNLPVAESVTGTAVKFIFSSRWDVLPQYSPGGNRIAFVSYRSGATEIWTCDSDGSNPVQLTSLGAQTGYPRWAPDGQRIGFSSDAEGHFDVYVVDAEGGAPQRLTSDPSMESAPSWSRNGEWIYFTSNRNGDFQNFKMPAGGGPAQVVTAGRFPRMESPDGQWFYFVRGANGSVWRMPVEGGAEEDAELVLESTHKSAYEVIEDGVYFIPPAAPKAGFSLQFLRFATGVVEPIHDFETQPIGTLSVAPDGRSILFDQLEPMEADIMLVENFR
jgi:Tol biopolymer transport system component